MHTVTQVEVLEAYKLRLTFDDGEKGIVDLSRLAGKGVFSEWLDYDAFKRVEIGSCGELKWSERIDLCPDSLYLQATGKTVEEVFPALGRQPTHA